MTFSPNAESPVLIISAGTIGLATGWELARKGVPVEVSERDGARRGATWKAGGMLTPVTAQKIANLGGCSKSRFVLHIQPRFS